MPNARHNNGPEEAALRVPADDENLVRAEPDAEGAELDKAAGWDQLLPSERSPLRFYLNAIAKTPLLTGEEEVALARRIHKGDAAARDHMIRANLRLVVRIARDYENFGLPILDLISEGNIGLVKAVGRFDPDKGGKLSTYAAWWIRQALKRALASHGKTIRLPVHMVDRVAAMRRVINSLIDELRREPTNEEIALVMDLPVRKIVHLRSVATRAASLDAPVGEEGDATFGDLIGDESQPDPFHALRAKSAAPEMELLLEKLEPREADIIRLRFGMGGGNELTLEEVGDIYGLTRERVRQLQHLAIMKLRRLMADRDRQRTSEDIREEARKVARADTLNAFFKQKQDEAAGRADRLSRSVKLDVPEAAAWLTIPKVAKSAKSAKSAPRRPGASNPPLPVGKTKRG
jgi:RNA polymerase primary sigma factor